ncbi:triose-phosphate isomerase [Armatimonas rosea]|uniref:Triosephosphate isomerase n=1 Tax=Armatimonas rosea TaxID=685828 RepID=A0A7W9SRK2_ARMRO|nr:triose-phosphate isomerase [Armatimonas rosea]MBB6051411.1 triosephosphate isomerase [Armatimonas rosea]
MARTPIIAGNWKMNKGTAAEASALAQEVVAAVAEKSGVTVIVCPPYTVLHTVRGAVEGSTVKLGAQDAFWKTTGAYTSQVSAEMLKDAGVGYVILGHSETRGRFGVPEPEETIKHYGETDATVNLKVKAVIAAGLVPIICIGETLDEREAGKTDLVVSSQVAGALTGVTTEQAPKLVFAYEPVWAIGTGKVCDPTEANRVCGIVRQTVRSLYGVEVADSVRVQYGGSMKPDNAAELLSQPHIDGGLIGGAALKAADFAAIINAA